MFAYAAYELLTFPIGPLATYAEFPQEARSWHTQRFVFVGVVSAPWKEREPQAAAILKQEIERETTDRGRQMLLAILNGTEYRSGLLPIFWAVVVAGLILFWAISYASVFVYRWVRAGFSAE